MVVCTCFTVLFCFGLVDVVFCAEEEEFGIFHFGAAGSIFLKTFLWIRLPEGYSGAQCACDSFERFHRWSFGKGVSAVLSCLAPPSVSLSPSPRWSHREERSSSSSDLMMGCMQYTMDLSFFLISAVSAELCVRVCVLLNGSPPSVQSYFGLVRSQQKLTTCQQ